MPRDYEKEKRQREVLKSLQEQLVEALKEEEKIAAKVNSKFGEQIDLAKQITADRRFGIDQIGKQVTIHEKRLDIIEKEKEHHAEIADKTKELLQPLEDAREKWKDTKNTITAIVTNPMVAMVALAGLLLKMITDIAVAALDFQLATGLGTKEVTRLTAASAEALKQTALYGVSVEENLKTAQALSAELGTTSSITADLIGHTSVIQKTMGLTAEEAAKATKLFIDMGNGSIETAKNTLEFAKNLGRAAQVAPAAIIQDITSNAERATLFFDQSGKNLIRASVAAKKLGIEFGNIVDIAEGLLNIENSVEAELEASVLLGRRVNLERARQLAFENDIAGMTKEIVSQLGSESEFAKLNIVQRKALASAIGVSADQLHKMIINQDDLNNLSEQQAVALMTGASSMDDMIAKGNALNKIFSNPESMLMLFFAAVPAIAGIRKGLGGLGGVFSKLKMPSGASKLFSAKPPKGGMFDFLGKMNPAKVLAGAAALVLISAALFISAKAFQEFASVEWSAMGKAGVALLGLTAALMILGVVMTSGVGAIAIIAGAAAMLIMAAALLVLGIAIQQMGKGFDMMREGLTGMGEVLMPLIVMLPGIIALSGALTALGLSMIPLAAGALLLLPALPVLKTLAELGQLNLFGGGSATTTTSAGETPEMAESNTKVVEKLDELITLVKQGGVLNIDGKKAGEYISLASITSNLA